MISRSFIVKKECLEEVRSFIDQWNESQGVCLKIVTKQAICADEIVSNIISYSGAKILEIECSNDDKKIELKFTDDGKAFNPLTDAEDPDITSDLIERKIGGLGIYMVKKMTSHMTYQRINDRNVLEIIWNTNTPSADASSRT